MLLIVDKYIIKGLQIMPNSVILNEYSTIIEWSALMSKPLYSAEIPKFYYEKGVIFTKQMGFNIQTFKKMGTIEQ